MNRVETLRVELQLPEYTALDDSARLASLHVEDITLAGSINSLTIAAKLELENKWASMNDLEGTEPYYDTAFHTTLVINTFESFDMNDTDQNLVYTRLVNALVNNNILTQEQVDEITATGYSLISRDTEIGVSDSSLWEVEQARTS